MPSHNYVSLLGHLGSDPEMTYTPEGVAVTRFSIATTRRDKEHTTDWHRCVAFNKTAEVIAQYAKKGDPLLLDGEINYRAADERMYTNIVVRQVTFLRSRDQDPEDKPKAVDHNDIKERVRRAFKPAPEAV